MDVRDQTNALDSKNDFILKGDIRNTTIVREALNYDRENIKGILNLVSYADVERSIVNLNDF